MVEFRLNEFHDKRCNTDDLVELMKTFGRLFQEQNYPNVQASNVYTKSDFYTNVFRVDGSVALQPSVDSWARFRID